MIRSLTPALSPSDSLRALIYLDWHIFLNRVRTIRRDPKRLLMWGVFILVILTVIPQRFLLRSSAAPVISEVATFLNIVTTFVPGLVLVFLGLKIANSRKAMGLFRSAADARFLCGSALPPRVIVLWLDFRMLRLLLMQLPAYALWFLIFASNIRGAIAGILAFGLSMGLFFGIVLGLNLPLVRLSHSKSAVLRVAGASLAVVGMASLGTAVSRVGHLALVPPAIAPILLGLPPGSWMVGGFHANLWAFLALGICMIIAFALTLVVAHDVYPEVWESSLRMITVRRLMRQSGGFLSPRETRQAMREAGVQQRQRPTAAVSSQGRHVPPGAWTLLWKEWLAAIRVRGGLRWPVITLMAAIVIGWGAGGGFGRLPPVVQLNLIALPLYLLVIINMMMSIRLGVDLRNPLWWLSSASLTARLLVLTLARSLRQVIPLAAGLLAAAIAAGSVAVFVLGLLLFAAAIWAVQAMGIGVYTIIPTPVDLRGPGQLLRMLVLLALLIPIVIVFTIAAVLSEHVAIGLLTASATAILEGWGLLMFAASRLQGNGLAFAQAERR